MKIIQACNDNVFIDVEKQKDVMNGMFIIKDADTFKTITARVLNADLSDSRIKDSKISIGDKILIHQTSIITEDLGSESIAYIKASSILAIIE